jgi:hypothetical protein
MKSQTELKTEISANHQAFQENSSKRKALSSGLLARGLGFEPTKLLSKIIIVGSGLEPVWVKIRIGLNHLWYRSFLYLAC